MNARQPDLFSGFKVPPKTQRPDRAYRRPAKAAPQPLVWTSMATWVRHMNRLFAIERPSSGHYARVTATAHQLTVDRVRECRHDDDLARVEAMLVDAYSGWLYGLDRAFTRAQRGELLVEVRNRRQMLALGRTEAKPKGPRFDPALMPLDAIERLIQRHPDLAVVEQLRAERARRIG